MDGKLVFISLTAANLLSDSSWWEIYDEAFPHTEREPPQVIIRSLERAWARLSLRVPAARRSPSRRLT